VYRLCCATVLPLPFRALLVDCGNGAGGGRAAGGVPGALGGVLGGYSPWRSHLTYLHPAFAFSMTSILCALGPPLQHVTACRATFTSLTSAPYTILHTSRMVAVHVDTYFNIEWEGWGCGHLLSHRLGGPAWEEGSLTTSSSLHPSLGGEAVGRDMPCPCLTTCHPSPSCLPMPSWVGWRMDWKTDSVGGMDVGGLLQAGDFQEQQRRGRRWEKEEEAE